MGTADVPSESRKSWLRLGLGYSIILLGAIGLIASLTMGVIVYQVGMFLGETWGTANNGLVQSSLTLRNARETVDMTGGTLSTLEEGLGDADAAAESVGQVLRGAERITGSIASSLSAVGESLETAGNAIPQVGQLGRMGSSLGEAGSEAREASRGIDSLNPVLQDLQGETDDIGQALDKTRLELPKVRRNLTEVSQGLESGALAIDSIAGDLEVLRRSGLLLWMFVAGLVYFSTLSLCLILLGVLLLTTRIP